MSHNIDSMAYVGSEGTPWHTLGNPVRRDMTVEEMREAAGLGWRVELGEIAYRGLKGEWTPMKDRVMYRSDTGAILSQVGPQYVPTQNNEVLEFFREYVEAGDMMLDTAGSLQKGRIVWALAKMNIGLSALRGGDAPEAISNDPVHGYVLISNPHQYGMGMTVKFTPVRVVCNNTLTMALQGGGESLRLWHNRPFDEQARQDAKRKLGIAREKFEAFEQDVEKLVATTLTDEDVGEVFQIVWPDKNKVHEAVRHLYDGAGKGSQMASAKGTAWGLLNATTEYYDWHAGKTQDSRVRNAWFGAGAQGKRSMMNALLGYAPKDEDALAASASSN
jgi:phage/plasmid-like protein (TIGR03299 family)